MTTNNASGFVADFSAERFKARQAMLKALADAHDALDALRSANADLNDAYGYERNADQISALIDKEAKRAKRHLRTIGELRGLPALTS